MVATLSKCLSVSGITQISSIVGGKYYDHRRNHLIKRSRSAGLVYLLIFAGLCWWRCSIGTTVMNYCRIILLKKMIVVSSLRGQGLIFHFGVNSVQQLIAARVTLMKLNEHNRH